MFKLNVFPFLNGQAYSILLYKIFTPIALIILVLEGKKNDFVI